MKNLALLSLMALFAALPLTAHVALATPAKSAPKKTAPAVQKITIALPGGYKPNAARVQAGKPVALTFVLQSDAGCGNTVSVPAAKWTKTLKVGQKATVNFTPKKSGPLGFACEMDMMKGTIVVK